MTTDNFITQLSQLKNNRFAFNTLPADQFTQLQQAILAHFPPNMSATNSWYLIGTQHCHLCDHAYQLLQQVANTHTLPDVIILDVMNAPTLIDTLGFVIPILLTPKQILCYPFGIMDIIAHL